MKKNILITTVLGLILFFTGCQKDFLDISPESTIDDEQLSTSPEATLGILRGIYSSLKDFGIVDDGNHEDYGHKGILTSIDFMGNDMAMLGLNWHGFTYNYSGRVSNNSRARLPWSTYYLQIKNTNIVINSIEPDNDDPQFQAIRGQALALRGYFHFMLARIYGPTYIGHEGDLSIPVSREEYLNERQTVETVYDAIIEDLEEAVGLLEGYSRPSREFVDESVVQAFLAEVYLEVGRYEDAAEMAHAARSGYTLLTQEGWEDGFYQLDQDETMWGAKLNDELSTWVANFFSHMDNTNAGYSAGGNIAIDKRLYEAISETDFRRDMFAGPEGGEFVAPDPSSGNDKAVEYGPYISFKFRDLTSDRTTGDYIYMRSAAMYYIEAEALARSNDETGAKEVLLEITKERDSEYQLSANSGQDLIDEIILQKRIELWGEGYSWFDLKRLNLGVHRDYEGSNHSSKLEIPAGDNKFLFMIPQAEMDANPEIGPNNPE